MKVAIIAIISVAVPMALSLGFFAAQDCIMELGRERCGDGREIVAGMFLLTFPRILLALSALVASAAFIVIFSRAVSEWARNDPIEAALEEAFAARSKRVEIDQDLVIRGLVAIASIDVRKLFAEDGTPRTIHELDQDLAVAISSLNIVERRADDGHGTEYVYRVRFWDKVKALELLGRHLGMFRPM